MQNWLVGTAPGQEALHRGVETRMEPGRNPSDIPSRSPDLGQVTHLPVPGVSFLESG